MKHFWLTLPPVTRGYRKACAIVLTCLLPALAIGKPEDSPRLAIYLHPGGTVETVADLVCVELTNTKGVEVLDRTAIRQVLQEQELAFSDGLSSETALKAGQILGCDIIAVLAKKTGSQNIPLLSLVAYSADTGIRLCDQYFGLDSEQPCETARRVSDGIGLILKRLRVREGETGGCTLSMVSARNVDLPREQADVPDTVMQLTGRCLLNDPRVQLLERHNLEWLNAESTVANAQRTGLLSSCYLVNLGFHRSETDSDIQVQVVLWRSDQGTKEVTILGSSTNAVLLANQIAERIVSLITELRLESQPIKHALEAEWFIADSVRSLLSNRRSEAAVSGEAALALAEVAFRNIPGDPANCTRVIALLEKNAHRLIKDGKVEQSVGLVARALHMQRNRIRELVATELPQRRKYVIGEAIIEGGKLHKFHDLLKKHFNKLDASTRKEVADLFRLYAEWEKELFATVPEACFSLPRLWIQDQGLLVDRVSREPSLPRDLRLSSRTYCMNYTGGNRLFRLEEFSSNQRRELFVLLFKWGAATKLNPRHTHLRESLAIIRYQSYVNAADLLSCYPNDFVDTGYTVDDCIEKAFKLVRRHFNHVRLDFAVGVQPKSLEVRAKILRQSAKLMKDYREKGTNTISIALSLAYQTKDDRSREEYLSEAVRQVCNPDLGDFLPDDAPLRRGEVFLRQHSREYWKDGILKVYSKTKTTLPDSVAIALRSDSKKAQEAIAPWASETRLFRLPPEAECEIIGAELNLGHAWLLVERSDPHALRAINVNLDTGSSSQSDWFNTDWKMSGHIRPGANGLLVPTSGGVLRFGMDDLRADTFTSETGLPALPIDSCVEAHGAIYIATSDVNVGQIHSLRLHDDSVQLLASSARPGDKTGLDNSAAYRIKDMWYDRDRNQLMLHSCLRFEKPGSDNELRCSYASNDRQVEDTEGVWVYDLATSAFSRLLCLKGRRNKIGSQGTLHVLDDRGRWLNASSGASGAKILDLNLGTFRWIFYNASAVTSPSQLPRFYPMMKRLVPHGVWGIGCMALLDKSLYVTHRYQQPGWAIVRQIGSKSVPLKLRDLEDKKAPMFMRVYDGKLLACTRETLWLLEPLPDETMTRLTRDHR